MTNYAFRFIRAAAIFQTEMNGVLQAQQNYAQAYIDDVIVFSDSWKKHCDHVRAVIDELKDRNFTIILDKCKWGENLTEFPGYVIGVIHVPRMRRK